MMLSAEAGEQPNTNTNNNNKKPLIIKNSKANTNSNSNANTNSNYNCTTNAHTATTTTKPKTKTKEKQIKSLHDLLLEFLDAALSCCVVAPCVIAYWRGTWELMGVLLFPGNMPLSALMSFVIGGTGHFFFTITQTFFRNYINPDKRRLTYYVISRSYTAIFGVVCVNMWRGSWILCDWLTSADSLLIICIVTAVSLLFLIATRTLRNLAAAPYAVAMDHKSDYFDVDTMFKVHGFHPPGLYVLDTLFSVFVIGTLVVIAWRGVWGIMDLTFYPHDRKKSYWSSLILGYTTVLLTFVIKPLIRFVCQRNDGMLRLVICDLFYFMIFFGAVNAWRGIWNLLDIYVYPDNKVLSYWITHVIPFLVLAALKCSNSILVRGVFIDAEGTPDECVEIPISYVKLHFQRERNKKALYSGVTQKQNNNNINNNSLVQKQMDHGDDRTNLIEKCGKMDGKIHPVSRDAAARIV